MKNLGKWERTEKAEGNDKIKLPNYDYLALFTKFVNVILVTNGYNNKYSFVP